MTEHDEKIKILQDTTNIIGSQLKENKKEFKKDQRDLSSKVDQAMVMLTYICDSMKITPDQIPENNEAIQHLNSPDSSNLSNSHEKPESPKTSSTPNQGNSSTNVQNRKLWNP